MNNFTKSELKDLLDCVEVIRAASTISEMSYGELAEKVMDMIDNYECNPEKKPELQNENTIEELAYKELKEKIVKLMYEFTDKYTAEHCYSRTPYILIDVLTSCLSDAQYQVKNYHPFTLKQKDHICFQIGDWYYMMKPLLEGQHNLGYMKEKLKTMICEDSNVLLFK